MRALLVCAAPVAGSEDVLSRLARDVDAVIAVDGGADTCRRAGVRPTLALGDFDSVSAESARWLAAEEVPTDRFPADKDETDLELAVAAARQLGADEVVITAAFSGRLDHTLAAVGALARASDLSPRIVEPSFSGWILDDVHRSTLALRGEGSIVSLLPVLSDGVVTAVGVKWPLYAERLSALGGRGMSNVISGPMARINVHLGTVLALCTTEADVVLAEETT